MAARVWDIEISAAVNAKINSKHGISADDVYEACIGHPIRAVWHEDADRGWRLLVTGTTGEGRLLKVVLYPVDSASGRWRLGTALVGRK